MHPSPDFLRQISLFRGLPPDALQRLADMAHGESWPEDAFVYHQDDEITQLFVVAQGQVRLFQLTPDGQQVIMHIAGPGEALGLLPALTHERASVVTVQAIEPLKLWVWPAADFRALMRDYPDLSLNALEILGEHVRSYQNRIRELATERVERRLARTLLRLVKQLGKRVPEGVLINLPLTRQDVAEMSGTTLYSASRILRAWDEAGIVSSGRERIVILAPHRLVAIAEDLQ